MQDLGNNWACPNALLGTYLGYLGFGYDAVIWMVSAQPKAMHWLTAESAKKYGIDYEPLSSPHAVHPGCGKCADWRIYQDSHLSSSTLSKSCCSATA
jgi:hypothetical protein